MPREFSSSQLGTSAPLRCAGTALVRPETSRPWRAGRGGAVFVWRRAPPTGPGRGGEGRGRLYLSAADEADQKVEREEDGDEDLPVSVYDGKLVTQAGDDSRGAAELAGGTAEIQASPVRRQPGSANSG